MLRGRLCNKTESAFVARLQLLLLLLLLSLLLLLVVADWWQLSAGWQLYDTWPAIMCTELDRNSSAKLKFLVVMQ